MKFAGYSLLAFLTLFVCYNVILKSFPDLRNKGKYQSWWEENNAKVQGYIYGDDSYKIVFAGTSMSAGIRANLFSDRVYSLGFVGGSSLTSLAIIKRSNKLPRIIVIETNWIERGEDEGMINSAFGSVIYPARQVLPSLREGNQPVNIIGNMVMKDAPSVTEGGHEVDSTFFRIRLMENINAHNSMQDTIVLQKAIEKLNDYLNYFNSRNVKIYLMELPTHPGISSSKKYATIRRFLDKMIDRNKVSVIPAYPDSNKLQTSDGYHLTKESMTNYSLFLDKMVR